MAPQAPPTFSYTTQAPCIHPGYPTLAPYPFGAYTQDPASPVQPRPFYAPSFGYPSPMSPSHPAYPPQPALYSPGYLHQHQQGGTWWYMPHLQPPYDAGQHAHPSLESPSARGYPTSSYAPVSTPSASSTPPPSPSPANPGHDKPLVRRAYHPNPPAHRSEWVMWAGNVPSDAAHDELWRFFTAPPDGAPTNAHPHAVLVQGSRSSGVISIFLISRSSCAFVNYQMEAHLHAAITRFNGVSLRPADPRCGRLVCYVRGKDDDLRGMGMHSRWVKARSETYREQRKEQDKEQQLGREQCRERDVDNDSDSETASTGSNLSGSVASTNSSLLHRHFPQRYFILKSLTWDDLDLSVRTGVWKTQKHDEGVLDRAFRTAKDAFLVFSVNKSSEFYGYARCVAAGCNGSTNGCWLDAGWRGRWDRGVRVTV
ncbi:YT521-B-like domain-containing protein [Mycena latifolia]|nr:YT521-B-like domain-containing protein [Mycena latifolia]